MRVLVIAVLYALLSVSSYAAQNRQTTHGDCSPAIIGDNAEVNCNAAPPIDRPSHRDAIDQMLVGIRSPIFDITDASYNNGYFNDDGTYTALVDVSVRLNLSCTELQHFTPSGTAGDVSAFVGALANGLLIIKYALLFGGTTGECRTGDSFVVTYSGAFQNTENGWALYSEDIVSADRE